VCHWQPDGGKWTEKSWRKGQWGPSRPECLWRPKGPEGKWWPKPSRPHQPLGGRPKIGSGRPPPEDNQPSIICTTPPQTFPHHSKTGGKPVFEKPYGRASCSPSDGAARGDPSDGAARMKDPSDGAC
jgi:hypothetical protein